MRSKEISKIMLLGCFIILFESAFIKFFQYKVLPDKYFYDSYHILAVMNGSTNADGGYIFAANFFTKINIFKFTTLQQWSYCLSAIFSVLLVIVLMKYREFDLKQFIFIYASVGLLNIYVFNLSKDIIQFLLFFIIYLILSTKIGNIKKLILSSLVLIYEAMSFRVYYYIMAILMVTIYLIYVAFIKNRKLNKQTVIKIILVAVIAFFMEVYVIQKISVDNYTSIIMARYDVNQYREDSLDAATIINDPFGKNTSYSVFVSNYLVNALRLMIPVELLFKSIKYLPFVLYQLFVTYNIFKMGTRINKRSILWLISVLSFMMVSIIFEPDFGSFIRHESTLVLFLVQINVFNNKNFIIKRERI